MLTVVRVGSREWASSIRRRAVSNFDIFFLFFFPCDGWGGSYVEYTSRCSVDNKCRGLSSEDGIYASRVSTSQVFRL